MAMNKSVWRTMLTRKSSYIGAVLLILISSAAFGMFVVAGKNVQENLDLFRTTHQVEDAHFIVNEPLQDVEQWETKYNVKLERRTSFDEAYQDDAVLRVLSTPQKMNRYSITSGEDLQQSGDLLLDPGFANAHNLATGDQLQLHGQTFTIRGTMALPDYIYPLKSEMDVLKNPRAFGVGVISLSDMEKLSETLTYYTLLWSANGSADQDEQNANSNIEAFKSAIHEQAGIVQWVDRSDNNRIGFVDGDIQGSILMGKLIPAGLLLFTMVLVSILIWRLLKQQYRQIGTLYALGFRRGEIMRHYMLYPVLIAAAGSVLGTVLGVSGIQPLVHLFGSFYNLPLIEIGWHPLILLIGLLLPFLFLLPVSALLIWRVLLLTPLALMRGATGRTKSGWLERHAQLERLPFKFKFQIRELLRHMPRVLVLLLGVTFASMLFLLGFVMKDSMDELVNGNYKDTYQYEYQYEFRNPQQGPEERGEKLNYASFTTPAYKDGDKAFVVYGIQPDAKLIRLEDGKGQQLSFDRTIMTKPLADAMGVREGERITLKNTWSAKSMEVTVDQIADTHIGDFLYMPLQAFNESGSLPADSYMQLLSDQKLDIDSSELLAVQSKQQILQGYEDLISPLMAMVAMIAIVAFIIGVIVMHVVFTMTIEENRGQISLLKIFGYRQKEVSAMILGPNKWLVLLGYLLSIPLILAVLQQMFDVISDEMGLSFPVSIQSYNLVIVFVLVVLAYAISLWANRKNIHRIPMEETLKGAQE